MSLFNNFILDMELVDIPFSGTTYTWSNMQIDPLLIKIGFSAMLVGATINPLQQYNPSPNHI
jgi:hypothetical protein